MIDLNHLRDCYRKSIKRLAPQGFLQYREDMIGFLMRLGGFNRRHAYAAQKLVLERRYNQIAELFEAYLEEVFSDEDISALWAKVLECADYAPSKHTEAPSDTTVIRGQNLPKLSWETTDDASYWVRFDAFTLDTGESKMVSVVRYESEIEKPVCTCSSEQIFNGGCVCGQIEKEKQNTKSVQQNTESVSPFAVGDVVECVDDKGTQETISNGTQYIIAFPTLKNNNWLVKLENLDVLFFAWRFRLVRVNCTCDLMRGCSCGAFQREQQGRVKTQQG